MFSAAVTASGAEPADTLGTRHLDEVVVTGTSAIYRVENPRPGVERLELSQLALTPAFGGECDIIRSMTLLPGVHSEGDGGGGYEVRGGSASQNLVSFDGITLYNPAHVMGIFSTFNDDALGSAVLYKGPEPAAYGGATSSVLDISLAPGDMEQYHGSATIGLLAAKIKAEGPVIRDRMSFAVAARRSYVDAFLKMVPKYRSTVMNFYDVSARLRYKPSAAHTLDATFFICHDNMAVSDIMEMRWGNIGASLRWTARASDRLTFTTTAALTHFDPRMAMDIMNDSQEMTTYIHDYALNTRIHWSIADNHAVEAGLRAGLYKVKSAEWVSGPYLERELRSLSTVSAWAEYSGHFFDRLDVNAGVRLDVSSSLTGRHFHELVSKGNGPGEDATHSRTYVDAEPRVSLHYVIDGHHGIKAGVGRHIQNLHAVRSGSTSFPFDRYALTSYAIRPETSMLYTAGYTGMTSDGTYDWSAEVYYRDMDHVYDFKDGRSTFSDIALENIILGGRGRSCGAEFMIRKNRGRLTGWLSYTLSRTQTRIDGINDGQWYNAGNDRRHDFSVTAIYSLSDRWSLSASWLYSSGTPLTAPDVKYEISGETCYYYARRNAYKTPPTHRLDIAATYTHVGPKLTYEWSFGLYNAYCRYNPYVIYFEDDASKPSGTRAVQLSMYGIIPSVSYTLKF